MEGRISVIGNRTRVSSEFLNFFISSVIPMLLIKDSILFSKELSREVRQNKRAGGSTGGKESHAIFKKRKTELAAAKKQRETEF